MEKSVYISEKFYNRINDIGISHDEEQMMAFGGTTIGDMIVVSEKTFIHFQGEKAKSSRKEVSVYLRDLVNAMIDIKAKGYDTFFMTHSHFSLFGGKGDLSDEDEVNSEMLRNVCSQYGMNYYDGITTGYKLYFWSTVRKNDPQLMDCYVDNNPVRYSIWVPITEKIEHLGRNKK